MTAFHYFAQRRSTHRDLDQRWSRTERRTAAQAQRRRGQTHAVAVHSRSRSRWSRRTFHPAKFFLVVGTGSRVRTSTFSYIVHSQKKQKHPSLPSIEILEKRFTEVISCHHLWSPVSKCIHFIIFIFPMKFL